jgi:GT2 family glycosyltransferase
MHVFSAKGACVLFRKSVLEKTGLFDKDYFAYFEETDLCMRIWLAGYSILYIPEAIVYHKGGVTSAKLMRSNILFHSYKNRIFTYVKNLSGKYLLIVLPQIFLIYQAAFVLYVVKGQFGYALAVQRGLLWNLFNLKIILAKRQHVQNVIRKISDDEYLPSVTKRVRLSYYYYQFFGGIENYKDAL